MFDWFLFAKSVYVIHKCGLKILKKLQSLFFLPFLEQFLENDLDFKGSCFQSLNC